MVALVINLEASKYSETNYNKVISTATHKRTKVKKHKTIKHIKHHDTKKTFKKFDKTDSLNRAPKPRKCTKIGTVR